MKKSLKAIITLLPMTFLLSGCGGTYVPDGWYNSTLKYYQEGFDTGWKNEYPNIYICDEMKDKNNKFGYLLKDLDGDGGEELLIGMIDNSGETKFTDLYIWHKDFGALRNLNTGDGYYFYLCDDNVLKIEKWYGSETQIDYWKYNSDDNSFTIVNGATNPQKCTLTEF